ncbi:MAG: phosphotransferase [Leptothrix sp. (in: b-proteobacteria)]
MSASPPLDPHAFDVDALAAYLSAHLDGFAGPLTLRRFAGGQSNPTYQLITPTRHYVLRTKPAPAAKLLPSAHAIEREFRVMRALAGSAVPVAAMHLLCEDESVIGRAFYVMAHVDGRVFWDPTLPDLTGAERGAIYAEMNRVLAALHSVDPVAVGLADYGKPGNYFERQIGRWSRQYLACIDTGTSTDDSSDAGLAPIDAMTRLIDWLPAHIPPSARDARLVSVVHGDYRLDNLMFHPTEPRVLAVLDWELSTLGHPLADFSYHGMAWAIPLGVFRGIGGADLAALGIPSADDHIARYLANVQLAGGATLNAEALRADWPFYLAYNLFRIAAILQGIARRARDGTASSSEAHEAGAAARPLAELAWQQALRFEAGAAAP